MTKIYVYECSEGEWVAARNQREALKFYISETGVSFRHDMEGVMPRRLNGEEMARFEFYEEHDADEGPHKSFRQKLDEIIRS